MAKRFTDTDKYKKPFLRGLQGPYKLLWDYIYHDCNHAGIWIVDFEIAQIYLGKDMPVNREDALQFFNADKVRVVEVDSGAAWYIAPFVEEQYGPLNPQNRVHSSVIDILKSYNLYKDDNTIKPLISPLQGAKDKDKDKDKYKDKDKDKEKKGGTGGKTSQAKKTNDEFEKFRQEYPGTKRGYTTELKALQKHSDWQDVIPLLKPALDNEIEWRKKLHGAGEFCPQWPHLQTWLNQRRWEQELKSVEYEQRNNKTDNKPSADYKADILRRMGIDPGTGKVF